MGPLLLRMCETRMITTKRSADAVALIAQGADVHTNTNRREPALLWACEIGHDDVAAVLLEMGAVE
jgi:ankyrin repeat protein